MRAVRPTLLAIATSLALFGCAEAPEAPRIVLRKPPPTRHVIRPTSPAKTAAAAPAQDETVQLSPAEKEALFRAFDNYLNEEGQRK